METTVQDQMTVLVVEDEPIACKMITSILSDAGFGVKVAADGRECMDLLRHFKPDVILMDVLMPKLDGLEACRKIKADSGLRSTPVLFVTGCTDDKTLEAAFSAGARDFIRKPINRIELLSRLRLVQELQKTHEKRIETEKLKGVLETAGGVCHKLNQPLQYILGAIQILMIDLDVDNKIYTKLDGIRDKIEQMGEITRKLAEITRYRTKAHAGGQNILDIDDSTGHDPDKKKG